MFRSASSGRNQQKIVDHTADINLTYSDIAREYLLREGLPADRIIKTGSPMFEVLNHYLPQIESSDVLSRLNLEEGKYLWYHPTEKKILILRKTSTD
jgi:UDP-N-acetylglucosamine 2-epimerase